MIGEFCSALSPFSSSFRSDHSRSLVLQLGLDSYFDRRHVQLCESNSIRLSDQPEGLRADNVS